MRSYLHRTSAFLAIVAFLACAHAQHPIDARVSHGFVKNGDVKLHYASAGQSGPLVVMLHGFPDYWYTWRDQMLALSSDHHVVAVDLRGYNKSDKPVGMANYAMSKLIGDVAAVIHHFGHENAIIVGHDWGGAIAWWFTMSHKAMVEKLIVCNLPHPRGMNRELANNPEQQKNSQYARNFQQPDAHLGLTAEGLAAWVKDPAARKKYVAAFGRSDFEAMLHYYKANYPRTASGDGAKKAAPAPRTMPKIQPPVLLIHGLADKALLAAGLNDTWEWLEQDLTLVTVPKAGHFVQHDASDFVTRTMVMWLHRDGDPAAASAARRAAVNEACPFSGEPIRADCLTRHGGKVIGFCNPQCRDKFAHAPADYPKALRLLDPR